MDSPMAAIRLRICSMLSPASTRIRVLSVASSAAFPALPLASTQNLKMSVPPRKIRIHRFYPKQNQIEMFVMGFLTGPVTQEGWPVARRGRL